MTEAPDMSGDIAVLGALVDQALRNARNHPMAKEALANALAELLGISIAEHAKHVGMDRAVDTASEGIGRGMRYAAAATIRRRQRGVKPGGGA